MQRKLSDAADRMKCRSIVDQYHTVSFAAMAQVAQQASEIASLRKEVADLKKDHCKKRPASGDNETTPPSKKLTLDNMIHVRLTEELSDQYEKGPLQFVRNALTKARAIRPKSVSEILLIWVT